MLKEKINLVPTFLPKEVEDLLYDKYNQRLETLSNEIKSTLLSNSIDASWSSKTHSNNEIESFSFTNSNTVLTDLSSYIEGDPWGDDYGDEEEPGLLSIGGGLDLNSLQQEMSAFGSDGGDIVTGNFEQQQEEDLLLVMNY